MTKTVNHKQRLFAQTNTQLWQDQPSVQRERWQWCQESSRLSLLLQHSVWR